MIDLPDQKHLAVSGRRERLVRCEGEEACRELASWYVTTYIHIYIYVYETRYNPLCRRYLGPMSIPRKRLLVIYGRPLFENAPPSRPSLCVPSLFKRIWFQWDVFNLVFFEETS